MWKKLFCKEILKIEQLLEPFSSDWPAIIPLESQKPSGMKSLSFPRTASLRPSPLICWRFARCWLCVRLDLWSSCTFLFFLQLKRKYSLGGGHRFQNCSSGFKRAVSYGSSHRTSFLSFAWHKKTRQSPLSFTGVSPWKCKYGVLVDH